MNLVTGFIFGFVAGVIGALVWAGIAVVGNVEIGWIAIGIGFLVGIGTSFGSKGGGIAPALIAALITVASIAGGKYFTVKYFSMQMDTQMQEFTEDDAIVNLILEGPESDLKMFEKLPAVSQANFEDDIVSNDFHPKVWAYGKEKWDAMTEAEQLDYMELKKEERAMLINQLKDGIEAEGFRNAWGPMDILFIVIGVVTAFQIGMSDPVGE